MTVTRSCPCTRPSKGPRSQAGRQAGRQGPLLLIPSLYLCLKKIEIEIEIKNHYFGFWLMSVSCLYKDNGVFFLFPILLLSSSSHVVSSLKTGFLLSRSIAFIFFFFFFFFFLSFGKQKYQKDTNRRHHKQEREKGSLSFSLLQSLTFNNKIKEKEGNDNKRNIKRYKKKQVGC